MLTQQNQVIHIVVLLQHTLNRIDSQRETEAADQAKSYRKYPLP